MNGYDEMLKRLRAYRKALCLNQSQICTTLGVSQEQYSYLENGLVKLTDDNLKALYRMGLSVDYLLTGEKYDYSDKELDNTLDTLDGKHKDFIVKMVAEVMVEKSNRKGFAELTEEETQKVQKNIKLLTEALKSWDNFSMIRFVKEDIGCLQLDMLQSLGIGIKKYRALEREEIYPDAELLLNFHEMSGYPPSMFMNICDRKLIAVKIIWSALCAEEKRNIICFIDRLNRLV